MTRPAARTVTLSKVQFFSLLALMNSVSLGATGLSQDWSGPLFTFVWAIWVMSAGFLGYEVLEAVYAVWMARKQKKVNNGTA
jgi:hypothetical protein